MPNTSNDKTRRGFVKASAVAAAGAGVAAAVSARAARVNETLALSGGPKTVTFPADRHTAITRWPRYGPAEKQALHAMIDSNKYY